MSHPLVSIIVPVYNAGKYLTQCLDSLTGQTYHNTEIICVNDGSTDNSLNIITAYQERDNRIHCIDKQNEGVSSARNDALKAVSGQLIMCVDADDWIDSETVSIAVNRLMETDSDVVLWPYISEKQDRSDAKIIFPENMTFDTEQVRSKLHRRLIGLLNEELAHPELADSLCTVWGKLYKADLLKDIQFIDLKEIGTYEDGLFNLEVFGKVKKAAYIIQPMYHYRRTNDSSQTRGYNEKLFSQWMRLFDLMLEYIDQNHLGADYQTALKNRITLSIIGLGFNIDASKMSTSEKKKELAVILNATRYKEAYKQLQLKWFPVRWKLFFFFAKTGYASGLLFLFHVINRIMG